MDTPSPSSLSSLIAGLRGVDPSVLHRLRRFDFERKLALLLSILAVISGIATYFMISTAPPYGRSVQTVVLLLQVDVILLLLLGVIIGRRLVMLVLEHRQGRAGSKLHGRLVALFAVVAVAPAIIVSVSSRSR